MTTRDELPVTKVRAPFLEALARAPVVLSSATGSGKSTEVPRWCAGRVLVVEPRRVACRTLAARVAELEREEVGRGVGYVVRDERRATDATRIVFATPGIVLRSPGLLDGADVVLLDELHERTQEIDLLLALLLARPRAGRKWGVMSATIDADRVAGHVGGVHVAAEGRAFPVDVRYLERGDALPDPRDLPRRVGDALRAAKDDPGDVLVFLPGKAEIDACRDALVGGPFALVPLHGGLELDEQRRAFDRTGARKVILATNVAETSLTIPGVGVVVDAGLVRQTRYHEGRGSLGLVPIAEDSADQRAGRAGRTGPGACYRMWSPAARLARATLPAIHRESLVQLVLDAAIWGTRPEDLPLLDPPKPYALEAARADLRAWRALDGAGAVTEAGRRMFSMPIEPAFARLLVAAQAEGCVADAVDLVAALGAGRPMFLSDARPSDPHDDLRLAGSDVVALVRAVRIGRPEVHGVSGVALAEARRIRDRLRKLHGAEDRGDADVDAEALARAGLAADPRAAHVARRRGRDLFFSNGGTELELARESAVTGARDVEAIVVFDTRAFGAGRDTRLLVTCATAVRLTWLARTGIGEDHLAGVRLEAGRVTASLERVYAGRVLAAREEVPTGALARAAIAELLQRGSLFREVLPEVRLRLARARLAGALAARGHAAGHAGEVSPSLDGWILERLAALGVESGDDVALLAPADMLPPELPFEVRKLLDREFPATVSVGDATYAADYDVERGEVVLRMVRGTRTGAPPLAYLPRFEGLRVAVEGPRGVTVLRARG